LNNITEQSGGTDKAYRIQISKGQITFRGYSSANTNLLLFPSVTTCSQSLKLVVIGHLYRAPEWFVPGCRFLPSGAPTSNLKQEINNEFLERTYGVYYPLNFSYV
jgi:hypothetical protein